ncbi:MAG: hypothetical protein IK058_02840 [Bacteroidales bacterium]|nr:hypothetical protein [Bacteroidales bacterium]
MQFKDIVGQRDVINRLTEIIDSGRISHAQLLLGDERDGSMQLAWAYLQYLCCEHRVHSSESGALGSELRADSCGECPSCKKISTLQHPDLHLIFPNATTDSVKSNPSCAEFQTEYRQFLVEHNALGTLDDWYAFLGIDNKQGRIRKADSEHIVEVLNMKPYEGGWRMLVIWKPALMNEGQGEAANQLLKTLEEPLPNTLILLVSSPDEELLPTVQSRVQMIRLKGKDWESGKDTDGLFAPMLVEWLRMLFKLRMKELATQVDKMASMGREQQKQFLAYALGVMRDCFLKTSAGLPCNLNSGDQKFDAMFPGMITNNNIELIDAALNDAIFAIERNAYGKIALMELSFRMSKALKKR